MNSKLFYALCALVVTLVIVTTSCSKEGEDEQKKILVTDVVLNESILTFIEGSTESQTLVATVNPTDADNKKVSWKSSNKAVASVENGVVKLATGAKGGDTAIITVTTEEGGKSATCDVTVEALIIPVTSVTLDESSLSLTEGDKVTLIETVNPSDATNKNVKWASDNEDVAKVLDGEVVAIEKGSATITVTTDDGGKTATCDITVEALVIPVTSVTLDESSLSLTEGDKVTLIETVNPSDATNKNVKWASDNEDVAKVVDGEVVAIEGGSATITVTTDDGGKTATCDVTVASIYTVTYDVDGGSAPAPTQVPLKEGETFVLADYDGEKSGFVFDGWKYDGKKLKIGNTYTIGNKDIILVADWVIKEDVTNEFLVKGSTITEYIGPGGAVVIPAVIDGVAITALGQGLFWNNEDVTSIVVSEGITRIEYEAIYWCSKLERVELPKSIEYIHEDVFGICAVMKDIVVDEGNLYYSSHEGSLYDKDLTTLLKVAGGRGTLDNIPSSVKTIAKNAAYQSDMLLESITIPGTVETIEESAFTGSKALKNLVLKEGIKTIGAQAFAYTMALTTVTIPASVINMGGYVFMAWDKYPLTINVVGKTEEQASSMLGWDSNWSAGKDVTINWDYKGE